MLTQERDFIIISLHISQDNAQEKIIGTQRETSYFGLDSFSSFSLTMSSANVNNNFIVLKQAKPLNISSLKANGQRSQCFCDIFNEILTTYSLTVSLKTCSSLLPSKSDSITHPFAKLEKLKCAILLIIPFLTLVVE